MEGKDFLISSCESMAYKIGHQMWKRLQFYHVMEQDDCISEAFLALVKAANGWRPDGGAKFSTYAWTSIHNHFFHIFNDLQKNPKIVLLSELERERMRDKEDGNPMDALTELSLSEEKMLEVIELLEDIDRFLASCTLAEQRLFAMMWEGWTQGECARKLMEEKVLTYASQPYVSSMLKKLKKKLKTFLL